MGTDENAIIKRLANRLIRYERLKIFNAPEIIVKSEATMIAEAIDQLEDIDCEKLRHEIEEWLIWDYKCRFLITDCFNCKNFSICTELHSSCLGCDNYHANTEEAVDRCVECCIKNEEETNRWIIQRDAHKKCKDYTPFDEEYHDKFVPDILLLAEILQKKYGIDKEAVENRINNLIERYKTLRAEILLYKIFW